MENSLIVLEAPILFILSSLGANLFHPPIPVSAL